MPDLPGLLLLAGVRWVVRKIAARRPGRHERKGKHEHPPDETQNPPG